MSSNVKLADDYPDIARRLKELESERWKRLQETKLPDVEEGALSKAAALEFYPDDHVY